ncbi:MAG: TonB-dependent receptor family protein [Muribaculaceae bacterium]|nr:TonB-dependent receptor family protein [Muribaculaceae bacterium]
MKRLFTMILLLCSLASTAHAQRITRNFQNVSMSDALKYIQQQTGNHKIVFIYNELEDFTVTTSVKNKPVPDAIRQIIGFYPIEMILGDNNDIYVECINKTEHNLKGMVVDENNLPLPYANVTLLNPADSTMVGGGVTNESGRFVIPNDHGKVIARITYVGYKPTYLVCSRDNVGTIKMQLDNFTLDGVTVKGSKRLTRATDRGLLANVQGTVLEQFGSVTEMLSHLPLMMGDGTIAGHGKPEIYINNKKLRDASELDRYRADEILSAEIITNPGPEYGQDVKSVIRLKTVKKQGEGLSGNVALTYRKANKSSGWASFSLNYRLKSGMDFFVRESLRKGTNYFYNGGKEELITSNTWNYERVRRAYSQFRFNSTDIGWNWDIGEKHSLGLTYTFDTNIGNVRTTDEEDERVWRDSELIEDGHTTTITTRKPRPDHSVNAYYIGEFGKWKFDFSADYYGGTSSSQMMSSTSNEIVATSTTKTKNHLVAEKLTITAPVPTGQLTFGEEVTNVNRHSNFKQSGFSADNRTHQQTSTWSLYANYSAQVKKFSFDAGLRWQNELTHYDVNGKRMEEMSPDYHVFIPQLSVSYQDGDWSHSLSYQVYRFNPPYDILKSSITYRGKYYYETGNPFLQPQTQQGIAWESSWKWIYAQVAYTRMKNGYTSFQSAYDDVNHPGVMLMDFRTWPSGNCYSMTLNFSPKVGIWQMNYSANFYIMDVDLEAIGIDPAHNWKGLVSSFTFDNTFNLPYSWRFNVQANLNPYYKSMYMKSRTHGSINLRLSKTFLKDKSLNVAARVNDVFYTTKEKNIVYEGINYCNDGEVYRDNQFFQLGVTWKFNATRSRYKGSHAGQDERNRL